MRLRIGQIRITPEKGHLDANHAALMDALRGVGDEPVDAVVTPECFLDGYMANGPNVTADTLRDYAVDPASSRYVADAAQWARQKHAWLVLGCTRLHDGQVFNSALVLDRAGKLAGIYDKTHCQRHDAKFTPGSSLGVHGSDFGAFGVMICPDRRWPETVPAPRPARTCATAGPNFMNAKNEHGVAMMSGDISANRGRRCRAGLR